MTSEAIVRTYTLFYVDPEGRAGLTDVRLSKRNLIAATACYLLMVLILIFFVALVTAHCPSARCAARAAAQWRWGWTIALVIYPVFVWISRRAIWRPRAQS